ncbi:MAG: branched-chain amino acid ABC transporter permease [Desulfobacterota bacterium]|nr:branched-chain amino acid ABC transporter permease [Thermodesulfobacteriota bacterium]
MEIFIYGITNSVTLALMAIGFSLTFGISGVPNFAHGAFYLLGGILTWVFLNQVGLPYLLSALLSILLVGFLGFLLYWGLLLRLRGLAINEVIATLAAAIVIIEVMRYLGFSGFTYVLPEFVKGSVQIGRVWLDYQRIFLVGIGIALLLFLYLFTHRTRIGLSFRAIAQNERTAISLGIDSDWTGALSLAFGSALAVVAGLAILPLGSIDTEVGYDILIYALAVGIVGGLESVPGIVVASFILGFCQILVATFFKAQWLTVVTLGAIVIILAVKPSGLFGKYKELEERV